MHSLTADPGLRDSLATLDRLTEIRDADGRVLGYFSPASRATSSVYAEAAARFDADEMRRRKLSGEKGLTTEEALKHVRSQRE